MYGKPEISEFSRDPFSYVPKQRVYSKAMGSLTPEGPSYDTVGQTGSLYDDLDDPIAATCRLVQSDGSTTLNVWVEDDLWDGGTVTSAMVSAPADRFLIGLAGNDVYDWVSGVFGDEWGAHSYPAQLIGNNDNITIFLYDIPPPQAGVVLLGFFYSLKSHPFTARFLVSYHNHR